MIVVLSQYTLARRLEQRFSDQLMLEVSVLPPFRCPHPVDSGIPLGRKELQGAFDLLPPLASSPDELAYG